jgi:predicted nucleotide-binding protein (sugar kinase/HSP70/actin superfamily)
MAYAGARLAAAAFRSIGIAATVAPTSDAETLELGGRHSGGEECLPHKVTLGDFLKVCQAPGFDPARTAFLMATAHGPCRFGQYVPYLRRVLDELGFCEVVIFSPTSDDGYDAFGQDAPEMLRTAWMAVVAGDIAQKFLLRTRPYAREPADADAAFERSLDDLERILAQPGISPRSRVRQLVAGVEGMRDRFRAVPADYIRGRPLIGLVGEIFCRLNTFSNQDVARAVERLGGECWLSDIAEWIWYTNWSQKDRMLHERGPLHLGHLRLRIKTWFQHRIERALYAPVADDFGGLEEPEDVREVLEYAEPYLPRHGSLGEMVLSVGKAIYLHKKGCDGILDISPFTCMNGIICEGVYPAVSADHDSLPIRMCYFDGQETGIERDLEIFLDLARSYQRHKRSQRRYPPCF